MSNTTYKRPEIGIDPELRRRFNLRRDAAANLEIAVAQEALGKTKYANDILAAAIDLEELAKT